MSLQFERLYLGQAFSARKTITAEMIELFAQLSGDRNPIHFDRAAAQAADFADIIAPDMTPQCLVSGILRTQLTALGGGVIWIENRASYKAPIFCDDSVNVTLKITSLVPKHERHFAIAEYGGEIFNSTRSEKAAELSGVIKYLGTQFNHVPVQAA